MSDYFEADDQTTALLNADVIFLGAGFSKAVTAGVAPTMREFFDTLDERRYWSLFHFLRQCFDDPRKADMEEALLRLDQMTNSPLRDVDPFFEECEKRSQDVRRELDRFVLDRLRKFDIEDSWATRYLFQAGSDSTVITTNYDNLAEIILSCRDGLRHGVPSTNCHHCKMCNLLEAGCGCSGDPRDVGVWKGSLIKLHGSVAWQICRNDGCCDSTCLLPDKHCRPVEQLICSNCGRPTSPVLVPPSMVKGFGDFVQLKRMWSAAYEALSSAKTVVFYGFSFPKSDALILQMLRNTMGTSKNLETAYVINTHPEEPAERLRECLNSACATKVHSVVVPEKNLLPTCFDDDAEGSSDTPATTNRITH